jgi:replicative DNA helicase
MQPNTNAPRKRGECETQNVTSHAHHSNSAGENQLPINLPAERSVLGAVIEDGALLPQVIAAGLRAEDFALSDHRRVFDAVLTLHTRKAPIDYVMVTEELGNCQEHYILVGSLIQGVVIDPDHILHHVAIIQRKARLRALLRLAEWITRVVDDTADPDVLIERAIGKLEAMATAEVRA